MHIDNYRFSLPSGLLVSANRYQPDAIPGSGVTLILAHCSSGHKEQWEPVLEKLFELAAPPGGLSPSQRIREAWAIDAPNHGDSALLNRDALTHRAPLSIQEYAGVLAYFVQSEWVKGRELIAVGHSASTSAWTIACTGPDALALLALILIEPVMVTPPILPKDPRVQTGSSNTAGVLSRKEAWRDRAELTVFLSKRYPWKIWNKRVLELYLKHGFVESPGSESEKTQVMPKSLREQEVGFYHADDHLLAGTLVDKMCARYPVHVIFGERPEMVSVQSRESICDTSQGRVMASIAIVPKCGHLAVQENPNGMAEAMYNILRRGSHGKNSAHL